jgi:hypothetical protein
MSGDFSALTATARFVAQGSGASSRNQPQDDDVLLCRAHQLVVVRGPRKLPRACEGGYPGGLSLAG